MRSIKPGRGPSFMGGFMGIIAALFGVFWMIMAVNIGAGPFALFGLFFIAIAIVSAIYHFKNATGKNRYSAYDITDNGEEPDPLNKRFGSSETHRPHTNPSSKGDEKGRYCPYCGAQVDGSFAYCRMCGKRLP